VKDGEGGVRWRGRMRPPRIELMARGDAGSATESRPSDGGIRAARVSDWRERDHAVLTGFYVKQNVRSTGEEGVGFLCCCVAGMRQTVAL